MFDQTRAQKYRVSCSCHIRSIGGNNVNGYPLGMNQLPGVPVHEWIYRPSSRFWSCTGLVLVGRAWKTFTGEVPRRHLYHLS
ncbi:hypothetical protein AMECASPLE_027532 [Ameca splendens]|uniref:Uncharacterized protein n=1 Tax=Ameca splendens TaxID=208324 RepID=A0ABV0Z3I3_9TELE